MGCDDAVHAVVSTTVCNLRAIRLAGSAFPESMGRIRTHCSLHCSRVNARAQKTFPNGDIFTGALRDVTGGPDGSGDVVGVAVLARRTDSGVVARSPRGSAPSAQLAGPW